MKKELMYLVTFITYSVIIMDLTILISMLTHAHVCTPTQAHVHTRADMHTRACMHTGSGYTSQVLCLEQPPHCVTRHSGSSYYNGGAQWRGRQRGPRAQT